MPHDNDHWVDEQLKTLNDTHGWQPSLESGEARLAERQRDRPRGFGGGWMPVAAIVAGAAVHCPKSDSFTRQPTAPIQEP